MRRWWDPDRPWFVDLWSAFWIPKDNLFPYFPRFPSSSSIFLYFPGEEATTDRSLGAIFRSSSFDPTCFPRAASTPRSDRSRKIGVDAKILPMDAMRFIKKVLKQVFGNIPDPSILSLSRIYSVQFSHCACDGTLSYPSSEKKCGDENKRESTKFFGSWNLVPRTIRLITIEAANEATILRHLLTLYKAVTNFWVDRRNWSYMRTSRYSCYMHCLPCYLTRLNGLLCS